MRHAERGKLIDLLVSGESFSVPTKTLVSLLKAQSTRRTSHLLYYVVFRDFCLIVQRFRTVLLYLSNYYHLK